MYLFADAGTSQRLLDTTSIILPASRFLLPCRRKLSKQFINMCVYIYIYICIRIHVYIYIYIYIYICYDTCSSLSSRCHDCSPATGRGRDKRGFHRRATSPIVFFSAHVSPHFATVCRRLLYVATFCPHFPVKAHEGESRHTCGDPVCPDLVSKLIGSSRNSSSLSSRCHHCVFGSMFDAIHASALITGYAKLPSSVHV